jgi:hypothetical protein
LNKVKYIYGKCTALLARKIINYEKLLATRADKCNNNNVTTMVGTRGICEK